MVQRSDRIDENEDQTTRSDLPGAGRALLQAGASTQGRATSGGHAQGRGGVPARDGLVVCPRKRVCAHGDWPGRRAFRAGCRRAVAGQCRARARTVAISAGYARRAAGSLRHRTECSYTQADHRWHGVFSTPAMVDDEQGNQGRHQSRNGAGRGGAGQLEQGLAENPASLRDRITLLAYFANAPAAANWDEIRKARVKHIAWLVENLPDSPILDSPLALINAAGGPLADQAGYGQVRDLWLAQFSLDPDKPGVLSHGTNLLRVADPEKTEQMLAAATAKFKNAAVWLGDLYGLATLGVTGLDLNTGLPVSAGAQIPETPFARKAREKLRATGDARVLLSGLAAVSAGGRSLAKAGHLPEGWPALCRELLDHARQIYPATSASCDTSRPETEERAPFRIRVGGNVQQAKLISQPPPSIPRRPGGSASRARCSFRPSSASMVRLASWNSCADR